MARKMSSDLAFKQALDERIHLLHNLKIEKPEFAIELDAVIEKLQELREEVGFEDAISRLAKLDAPFS